MIIVTDVLTYNSISTILPNYKVYNISSMAMNNYHKLNIYPSQEMIYAVSHALATQNSCIYDLDQLYANMLMSNDSTFIDLMQIMKDLYYGYNVVLLVYREEQVFDSLTESLCKFIQQRYGYNYQLINNPDDLNLNDNSAFSVAGISNFDLDNMRYLGLVAKYQPRTFMDENIAEKNGWLV